MDGENHVLPNQTDGWITEHPPTVPGPAPGRTVISEAAVAKVAAVAARLVDGVYALGSGSARALGAIRDVVGSTDLSQGVRVEVGETQVAVDINLVAEYGSPLQEVANRVRAAVYTAVEALVGLSVIEVNIEINDVHVAGYEPERAAPRPRLSERLAVPPAQHAGTGTEPLGAGYAEIKDVP
jgi:uncharacterized alkaline shock family protein YloU